MAALVAVASSGGASRTLAGDTTRSQLVLSIPGSRYLHAAAQNGPYFAVVTKSVHIADLRTGKWIRVATARTSYDHHPAAVAGSTVIWLEEVGGMSRKARLHAATPGRRKRLARWFEPATEFADGPFGGVAASGRNLVYSLLLARYDDADACIDDGKCRAHVRGGGTMLLSPRSLTERRILSPARSVAVDGDRVAAAIVRPGSLYTGRAQIVVLNLVTGALRFVGATTFDDQLALDRNLVVGTRLRVGTTVRTFVDVWDIALRRTRVKTYRFRGHASVTVAAPHLLVLDANNLFAVDLRNDRRSVISRSRSFDTFGPWVWRKRVYWVERFDDFSELRSAPLPSS